MESAYTLLSTVSVNVFSEYNTFFSIVIIVELALLIHKIDKIFKK